MITVVSMKSSKKVRLDIIIYLFCHKALVPIEEISKNITVVEFNNHIYYLVQEN